jgi:hypothetical protein
MDPELKQALSDMENRFYQHVDARLTTTETKLNDLDQRLQATERRFGERLQATESRVGERLQATEHWFSEQLQANELKFSDRLEGMETKLLTAFHDWARTYEVRARGTSTAVRELDERLGMVEERIAKLERGRNGGLKN